MSGGVLIPGEGLQLVVEGCLGHPVGQGRHGDGRRKIIRLTQRGVDSLSRSAAIFDDLRAQWAKTLGVQRLGQLEADLRTMAPVDGFRLDAPGWFGP
jgi:hypothetical protein